MRQPVFNYVLTPSMDVNRTELSEFGEIGKSKILKKLKKVFVDPLKKAAKLHRKVERKVWNKTMPKSVRKVFTRENFLKIAPILSIVVQVLNIIPGLGVAVGLAITAGAAAIAAAQVLAQRAENKHQIKKAEDDANAQANAAFVESQDYFTQKYNVTEEQFRAMHFEEKMNFLQVAAEDADQEAKAGQGIFEVADKPPVLTEAAIPAPAATPKLVKSDAKGNCPAGYKAVTIEEFEFLGGDAPMT